MGNKLWQSQSKLENSLGTFNTFWCWKWLRSNKLRIPKHVYIPLPLKSLFTRRYSIEEWLRVNFNPNSPMYHTTMIFFLSFLLALWPLVYLTVIVKGESIKIKIKVSQNPGEALQFLAVSRCYLDYWHSFFFFLIGRRRRDKIANPHQKLNVSNYNASA